MKNEIDFNIEHTDELEIWILNKTYNLTSFIDNELKNYRLYNICEHLIKFINIFNNGYNKLNRYFIKGKKGFEKWNSSLITLYKILFNISIIMQPIIPFFSDYIYLKLQEHYKYRNISSVHLLDYNDMFNLKEYKNSIGIDYTISIIESIRKLREQNNVCLKYPIKNIIIGCSEKYKHILYKLIKYIKLEGNIINISFDSIDKFISLLIKPKRKLIGQTFRKNSKKIFKKINSLTKEEIIEYINLKQLIVDNIIISNEYIDSSYSLKCKNKNEIYNNDYHYVVKINFNKDDDTDMIFYARCFATFIQKLRKKASLKGWDKIKVYFYTTEDILIKSLNKNTELINSIIQTEYYFLCEKIDKNKIIIQEENEISNMKINIILSNF